MPSLLFTIPTGTDRCIRNRCSKQRWSYLLMPFRESRNTNTGKQIWMPTKAELFPDSFTNHNTENYLRHGINITTNQRLSQHSGETGKRLSSAIHRRLLSRFFLREGGRLYTGYSISKSEKGFTKLFSWTAVFFANYACACKTAVLKDSFSNPFSDFPIEQ